MPVQTAYEAEHEAAYEGQRANLGLINIISKVAQAGDVPFGRAVVRGTADNQAKLPTAASQGFLGITEKTSAWAENASDLHLYAQYREMNIINFGELWVYTEQAVVPGDSVYFRHTADTAPLDIVGRFRKDASGADAELITGASFETTTAAGGIAKINLNTPGVGVLLAPDSSETITATTAIIGIDTSITYVDTTLGAMAASLADGTEGQLKRIVMTVDGGDCIITPANLALGATLRLTEIFDYIDLQFSGTSWKEIGRGKRSIVSIVATSGAMPLDADLITFDSTAGAATASLADGYKGQIVTIAMLVDGGDVVITPANLEVGLTLRLTEVGSSFTLQFSGTSWKVIDKVGLAIITITAATTAAMPLDVDLFIFDTTVGASTGGLAAGYPGQRVSMKMLVDGGNQVITPAVFLDGTIITFDATDGAVLISDGTNWMSETSTGAIT